MGLGFLIFEIPTVSLTNNVSLFFHEPVVEPWCLTHWGLCWFALITITLFKNNLEDKMEIYFTFYCQIHIVTCQEDLYSDSYLSYLSLLHEVLTCISIIKDISAYFLLLSHIKSVGSGQWWNKNSTWHDFTTGNWESSWCQLCCHWWHCRLSWQPAVPPVATKLASWQLSIFSDYWELSPNFCDDLIIWNMVCNSVLNYSWPRFTVTLPSRTAPSKAQKTLKNVRLFICMAGTKQGWMNHNIVNRAIFLIWYIDFNK